MPRDVERANVIGWVVVAIAFVALTMTYSVRSSVGVLMPVWEQDLGWSRTLSSSGSSLVLVIMAIVSPLAGDLMDRYGPRLVFAAGLLLLGIAVVATSRISEEWQFLFLFGFVGGLGHGALALPLISAATALYFVKHRGLATSIAMSGSTGGQLPVLMLLGFLVTAIGWRSTYVVFGLAVLVLVPATLIVLRRRTEHGPLAPAGKAPTESLMGRLRFLAGDRTFLLLFGTFVLCGFTTAGVIDVHFVPYAVASGFTLVDSTAAYGVHGLFNMFGLILAGWLADRANRPRLLSAIYFVRALSFVLLLFIAADVSLMFVFAAIFGLLNFSVLPLIASIVASQIGLRIMGLSMGLLFGGHSLGGAVGAIVGGYFYDLFGGYELLWIVSAAAALLAAFFSYLVPETRKPRQPCAPAAIPA